MMTTTFRNLILLVLATVLLSTFSSCGKEDPAPDPMLSLSTNSMAFSFAGETKSFNINANQAWSVSSSETWLTLSPVNGNSGTFEIDAIAVANPLFESRIAIITATMGSLFKTIAVHQAATSILTVSENEFTVEPEGDEISFQVESSGTYKVTVDVGWIVPVSGGDPSTPAFTVKTSPSLFSREGTIKFSLDELTAEVKVTQEGNLLTIPADNTGMNDNAITMAPKMGIGWNLGNSLEATSGPDVNGVYTASEIAWGNPKTNKAMIDAVKAAGFNTVRIPCAWSGYIEDNVTYKIKDSWLTRVKEVVEYCQDNNMYAIINVHWDGGWLEEHPLYSHQVEVNEKQKALWEQIAVAFRNYDERLLFAGTNEVHADYNTPSSEHIEVQESFNQTFVDAVRSTGGKNTYRNLIVQGYNTNIGHTDSYMTMPTDATNDRLMAEVHFYDPYDFTLNSNSTIYFWGADFAGLPNTANWGQEDWVDSEFARMKNKFVDNNIPVILGEYGVMLRTLLTGDTFADHVLSRNHYLNYTTKSALENGLVPIYWDNGPMGNNSSGLFNRATASPVDTEALNAILSAK